MGAKYDSIGVDYARLRRPDPRIAATVREALGDARSILNVGAGTGSYEPSGRDLVAVEPSAAMVAQRGAGTAPVIRARAEALPFADDAFDACMAVLTVHHWSDRARGLREMRRVARGRVVLLTFDPSCRDAWLLRYFPELATLDEAQMPAMADYERWLGPVDVSAVPVPHDCVDGFLHAYWRRPHAYLDPRLRSGSSSFWALGKLEQGLARLARDLADGEWARRHADLLALDAYDVGYRLVVAA